MLSLTNIGVADGGQYVVVANNQVGVVTGQVATLSVIVAPPLHSTTRFTRLPGRGHGAFFGRSPGAQVRWVGNGISVAPRFRAPRPRN
jgi:hypothetical protein